MFGYSRDELVCKTIELLVPESVRPRHAHHVSGYTSAPHAHPMGIGMNLVGRNKDGSEIPVEVSLSPLHSATSRPFVGTACAP